MSIIPPNPRLERHLRLARMIMSWERVWPRLIPPLTIVMLIAGLTLTGTFEILPATGHIMLLSILSVAGLVAIILPWRHFAWPNRRAVLQRIEQENGLENNPLQSLEDHIDDGDDPLTSYLWQKQLQRHEAMLDNLHLPRPLPSLARIDRYGLVVLPVLLLAVGLFVAHDRMGERFYKAFSPLQRLGAADFSTTLWVTPPAYTGQIPRVLRFADGTDQPQQQPADTDAGNPNVIDVDVPVGSTLAGSIGSVWQPTLHTPTGERDISESSDNSYVISTALDQAGPWRISVWGNDRLTLNVNLVADKPPALSFVSPPSATRRDHIRLDYVATDDYGMNNLDLIITPATDGIGAEQFGSIDNIRIDMSGRDGQGGAVSMPTRIEGPRFLDLVSHPWAGLPVNLQLVSQDNSGQRGESDMRSIVLPEREFTHPVAKKLITIRRGLLRYPDKALEMRNALLPVLYAPQAFNGHIGIFLALSVTEARLSAHLRDRDTHQEVAGLLWHIAEEIERGSYGMAERNLMEAEERLLEALADPNVTEAEIAELIENYRRALNEYMAALAREAPQNQQSQQQAPAAILEQQDLSRIVDQIDALMRAGARDQARALIDRLRELVENMQVTSGDGGTDITSTLREMLDGIRDLARRQQELMNQGDNPSNNSGGNGNRAEEQQNLAGDAQNLTNNSGFGQFGNLSGIETAIEAMQRAAEALGRNRAHEALQQQGQAMEALQRGIGELSRALEGLSQMMPMLDELRGSGNRDPLGRPVGGDGTTVIPEVDTLERAWRILQELRRRSGDPDRPVIEQEYIDRLLKRF
ncbi:DUF4175 family protein [Thalassospira sp. A3_1]|uniref:DUF4175 domain-containing protein n=1 Tax=Thalassospira sp. A3_1 TaxID=2821088 RepID=UPI001FFE27FF|nr:DUF4175 family protein [Thalassospira sp. A3_1]